MVGFQIKLSKDGKCEMEEHFQRPFLNNWDLYMVKYILILNDRKYPDGAYLIDDLNDFLISFQKDYCKATFDFGCASSGYGIVFEKKEKGLLAILHDGKDSDGKPVNSIDKALITHDDVWNSLFTYASDLLKILEGATTQKDSYLKFIKKFRDNYTNCHRICKELGYVHR